MDDCCIVRASCSIYWPFIKNIKSFSDVAVKSLGAEAVIAEKLAVAGIVIEDDFLTNCFLRYACCVSVWSSIYVLVAFSVTNAVALPSVNAVSFEIWVIE